MHSPITYVNESKNWKAVFLALSLAVLVILPFLSRDYGQSGDEWIQIEYGKHVWDYFFNDDKQALDYSNMSHQFSHQEYYGGLFDFGTHVVHEWFPATDILTLRHFFNALLSALLMIFTGLLARKLSGSWAIGVLGLLFILFSPRIFGEGMNNPKDIPLATGFAMGIYFLVSFLFDAPQKLWRNALGIGLAFALSFGVRSAGGFLLLAFILFSILVYLILNKQFRRAAFENNNALLKKGTLALAVMLLLGYIIGLSTWPWGLQSPIGNPLESLSGMTNRESYLRVLFEGRYRMNNNLPWYYEFKWILISNPLIVLAGFIVFIASMILPRRPYGTFTLFIILFGAFFPLLYMVYKNSTVYDTWRHVFFVYPFWVAGGALGFHHLRQYMKTEKLFNVPVFMGMLGLLPAIIWTVRSHPNQSVYFNETVGGPAGAYGYYDLDYYQNSGKQAANWIKTNIKSIAGRKIIVASNLSAYYRYFADDTPRISVPYVRYSERHGKDWDYYITYPRYISAELLQNDAWGKDAVHWVEIDGAPLTIILGRKTKAGIPAFEAFEKKDYPTAIQKYRELLSVDATDENAHFYYGIALAYVGELDAAIAAVNKALEIDPSRSDFYDMLSKIYGAKGDMSNAQQAMLKAQGILMEEQGEEE
jgi:hypothetical protein